MFKLPLSPFLDVLFPKSCHLCARILHRQVPAFDDNICGLCAAQAKRNFKAQYGAADTGVRGEPDQLLACYAFEGPVRELVHRFKYQNRPYLARTIVRMMDEVLIESREKCVQQADCLVPVPLHAAREREREFNQAEAIARELGTRFHKPVYKALRRARNTRPQSALGGRERLLNLRDAFIVAAPSLVREKNVLLIDDVVTTAATVTEATRPLRQAGARHVSVLAFARG